MRAPSDHVTDFYLYRTDAEGQLLVTELCQCEFGAHWCQRSDEMKGAGWRRKVRQMTDGTAEGALRSITDNNSVVMSARAATWRLTHTHKQIQITTQKLEVALVQVRAKQSVY